MTPEPITHSIVYWGRRSGAVTKGPTKYDREAGYRFIRAVQRDKGRRKNSGPVGRRKTRWYQGKFRSGYHTEKKS